MEEKEAIKWLKLLKNRYAGKEYNKSLRLAIKALKMQIPIEPNRSYEDGEIFLFCPNCSRYIKEEHYFCIYCGQSIDWGKYYDKQTKSNTDN